MYIYIYINICLYYNYIRTHSKVECRFSTQSKQGRTRQMAGFDLQRRLPAFSLLRSLRGRDTVACNLANMGNMGKQVFQFQERLSNVCCPCSKPSQDWNIHPNMQNRNQPGGPFKETFTRSRRGLLIQTTTQNHFAKC